MEQKDKLPGRVQNDGHRSRAYNEDSVHLNRAQNQSAHSSRHHPGIPPNTFGSNISPEYSLSFPTSYQPVSVCMNCIILGNELNCTNNSLREVSLMLTSKVKELEKCLCELNSCHNKINDLENEVEQFKVKFKELELEEENTSSEHCFEFEDINLPLDSQYHKSTNNTSNQAITFSSGLREVNHHNEVCMENSEGSLSITGNSCMDTLHYCWQDSTSNSVPFHPEYFWKGSVELLLLGVGLYHLIPLNFWDNRKPSAGVYVALHICKQVNTRNNRPNQHQVRRAPDGQNPQRGSSDRETTFRNDTDSQNKREQLQGASSEQSFQGGSSNNSSASNVIKEIKCDLFKMPESYALAHCVGSDFIMSSGIAVKFRKNYRQIPELLEQNKNPGQVAFLKHKEQYIYYLVTKLCSTGKPKWKDFETAVVEWRNLCVDHKIKKIAIPKIGCGRDLLDWKQVSKLINQLFSNTGIEITVCIIDSESPPDMKWKVSLKHCAAPLSDLDPRECALVFIASKDHYITPGIERLARKYGFESDYKCQQLSLGSLFHTTRSNNSVNIFGLVVKDCHNDAVSFCSIGKCLQDLKKVMKKSKLWYIGFEAFDDPKFSIATQKVWTIIIDTFFLEEIEVHFCWPEEVVEKCWEDRK